MSPLTQALSQGFSPDQVIEYLLRHFPRYSRQIHQALAQGFSANQVLKYLNKGRKGINEFEGELTEHEKTRKSDIDKQRNLEKNIGKGALALGAAGLGAYGLSRGLQGSSQAIQGELLPALSEIGMQERLQLPAPGQAPIQPPYNPNGPGEPPLPYSNPTAQGISRGPSPNIGQQVGQQAAAPVNQAIQPNKPIPQTPIPQQAPSQVPPLPKELETIAQQALETRNNSVEAVEALLKFTSPKLVKEYEKATNTPIRSAIEEFSKTLSGKTQTPAMGTGVKEEQNPIQGKVSESSPILEEEKVPNLGNMAKGMIGNFYEGIFKSLQEGKDTFSGVKDPLIAKAKPYFDKGLIKSAEDLKEFANNPDKFKEEEKPKVEEKKKVALPKERMLKLERGATVSLPDGSIGEIQDIRQGIASVNADGRIRRKKLEELEQAPEGLDEAARHLVNLIPEKEKSTAFQESIHISLPSKEGGEVPVMLTKYYNGKWGWYIGVSNDDYSQIALGTFEPKGEKRTGIGEYKPGVIDSRGAGNQQLIIQNPKYSKANKGITWGYADTKYNMLGSIQETLNKMSKEELDEKGNIKQKR